MFTAGSTFDEQYEIVSSVAAGGFGTVFRARQSGLDRIVALKILDSVDRALWLRFEQEARILTKLNHRNIVQCYRYGMFQDRPYMIMEYAKGTSLAQRLFSGALSPAEAIEVARQVGAALECAHANGIVHRDLKPENIIFCQPDESDSTSGAIMVGNKILVKVIDFGLAKLLPHASLVSQKLTEVGQTVGTAYYMSPEQCMAKALDHRSDIYSLGCILWACLCGLAPFTGEHAYLVMRQQCDKPLPLLPDSLRLPVERKQALDRIIQYATQKLPEDRYQNVFDLVRDLGMVEALPDPAKPHSQDRTPKAATPPVHKDRRRTIGIVLSSAAVAVLMSSLAFFWLTISHNHSSMSPASDTQTKAKLSPAVEKLVILEDIVRNAENHDVGGLEFAADDVLAQTNDPVQYALAIDLKSTALMRKDPKLSIAFLEGPLRMEKDHNVSLMRDLDLFMMRWIVRKSANRPNRSARAYMQLLDRRTSPVLRSRLLGVFLSESAWPEIVRYTDSDGLENCLNDDPAKYVDQKVARILAFQALRKKENLDKELDELIASLRSAPWEDTIPSIQQALSPMGNLSADHIYPDAEMKWKDFESTLVREVHSPEVLAEALLAAHPRAGTLGNIHWIMGAGIVPGALKGPAAIAISRRIMENPDAYLLPATRERAVGRVFDQLCKQGETAKALTLGDTFCAELERRGLPGNWVQSLRYHQCMYSVVTPPDRPQRLMRIITAMSHILGSPRQFDQAIAESGIENDEFHRGDLLAQSIVQCLDRQKFQQATEYASILADCCLRDKRVCVQDPEVFASMMTYSGDRVLWKQLFKCMSIEAKKRANPQDPEEFDYIYIALCDKAGEVAKVRELFESATAKLRNHLKKGTPMQDVTRVSYSETLRHAIRYNEPAPLKLKRLRELQPLLSEMFRRYPTGNAHCNMSSVDTCTEILQQYQKLNRTDLMNPVLVEMQRILDSYSPIDASGRCAKSVMNVRAGFDYAMAGDAVNARKQLVQSNRNAPADIAVRYTKFRTEQQTLQALVEHMEKGQRQ